MIGSRPKKPETPAPFGSPVWAAEYREEIYRDLAASEVRSVHEARLGWAEAEKKVDLLRIELEATRHELSLAEHPADVWLEGYEAGHEDARAVQETYPDPTPNPYIGGEE